MQNVRHPRTNSDRRLRAIDEISSHKDRTSTQPNTDDGITTTHANTDNSSHQHIFPPPQNHIPQSNFGDNQHHSDNNLHIKQPDHRSNQPP
ncbi:hypothetical protein IV203_004822 [Nitzschia inconspicua]|uniref:Uncharacterized protein n=1 Tax=Nitzschia inconspicua TaxID=303405 RepID=A0A9K3P7P5_9STRA|nr:hypothetical protein IV203_004822 [Nitzschia inconspicua]